MVTTMTDRAGDDITLLLEDAHAGRPGAMDRLMDAVYADLQRVAERHMAERFGRDLPGVTLEPAALVNESFMKLIRQRKRFDNRGQFFAIATRIMLRVLVDYQRRRLAQRRGGGLQRVTLSLADPAEAAKAGASPEPSPEIDVTALVTALDRLEALDVRKADVVKLRVVWGLEMKEVAHSLDVSLATVERDWAFAKAWLAREAARSDEPDEPDGAPSDRSAEVS
jgi:RNA polymerase sigma factor (TIGR02999 family)